MRPQAEYFEVVEDAVRGALEEIADPAWAAAQAVAGGVVSKKGELRGRDEDDGEEKRARSEPESTQLGRGSCVALFGKSDLERRYD